VHSGGPVGMTHDDQKELAGLLRQMLIRHSRVPLTVIRDEDVLTRDLGFDSFALLNVILDLEDELSVEADPDGVSALRATPSHGSLALVEEHAARPRRDRGIAAAG